MFVKMSARGKNSFLKQRRPKLDTDRNKDESMDDGSNHRRFRYEDIIVPYIILDGGLSNE